MSRLKQEILLKIYQKYDDWAPKDQLFCHKGCSACCTCNVMMTAVEGDQIYDYVREQKREEWLADCLSAERILQYHRQTTNGYARLCLEQSEEADTEEKAVFSGHCPFLEGEQCGIYPARPMACRTMCSIENCNESGMADLPEGLLVINTVSMQFVEHLGQKEYWGNMLDVLLAMTDIPQNEEVYKFIRDDSTANRARARLLKAEPIAGFLLMPGEEESVNTYLQSILTEKIGERTIDQILNNR